MPALPFFSEYTAVGLNAHGGRTDALTDPKASYRRNPLKVNVKECGAPGEIRTPGLLVRRPSLDHSQVNDSQVKLSREASNISAGYVGLTACLPWVVTSSIGRDQAAAGRFTDAPSWSHSVATVALPRTP